MSITTLIFVEGRQLEIYHKNLANYGYEYAVYQDKIWQIVGKQGAGIKRFFQLERKLNNENLWINSTEILKLQYILKPTGYIPV